MPPISTSESPIPNHCRGSDPLAILTKRSLELLRLPIIESIVQQITARILLIANVFNEDTSQGLRTPSENLRVKPRIELQA
jgi:hypothetical protein